MEEIWAKIYEFTDYSISTHGQVRNDKFKRLVKQSITNRGVVRVGLFHQGKQYTRSVKVLVADTFVARGKPNHDTAMQLDCDPFNCHVDNLVWRPRWFCWKYAVQMNKTVLRDTYHPIQCNETNTIYDNVVDAAMHNGLLISEILIQVGSRNGCFPLDLHFSWVRE